MPEPGNMDIDLLRTFMTVAQLQTFIKASVRLGKTQGAVSQQMQRLEGLVGTPAYLKRKAERSV